MADTWSRLAKFLDMIKPRSDFLLCFHAARNTIAAAALAVEGVAPEVHDVKARWQSSIADVARTSTGNEVESEVDGSEDFKLVDHAEEGFNSRITQLVIVQAQIQEQAEQVRFREELHDSFTRDPVVAEVQSPDDLALSQCNGKRPHLPISPIEPRIKEPLTALHHIDEGGAVELRNNIPISRTIREMATLQLPAISPADMGGVRLETQMRVVLK
eukprot:CAMPEP_0180560718 /NCGR_PEP_ID=MMETSP1037_2-20121125/2986_1 /TAXON_ID=632150 /ORGANISM="Azadinium spinosum, Strain 3D9" /LENGTH=214 /DNA_ID=CAMNT_0022577289 /DNA_START=34 /DNA_END=678 /DNA_ORIENTATION=+